MTQDSLTKMAEQLEGKPGVTITRDAFGNVISIDQTTPGFYKENLPDPWETQALRPGRGGARQGSGRKPITDETRRRNATVSFRVRETTRAALQELRAQGIDINAELERLVARLAKRDTKG